MGSQGGVRFWRSMGEDREGKFIYRAPAASLSQAFKEQ
jgi:hypothetical protein